MRDFATDQLTKAPISGDHHNGLPTTRAYRYMGKGYDQFDTSDPNHPDYVNPRIQNLTGPKQHGTAAIANTGCKCAPCTRRPNSTAYQARRTSRAAADKARATR